MGHRRYLPIGTEPVYDRFYDRLKMESVIMNARARATTISHAGDYSDPQFLKSLKDAWEGNSEGKHYVPDAGKWRLSRIPGLKDKLEQVEDNFKKYQQKRINEGYPKPEELPPELKEPKLKLEARLDIAMEELDYINEHIEKVKNKEEEVDDSNVLKRGPVGTGSLRDGMVDVLDGQKAGLSAKGLLIIKDSRSPYNGMSIADYRGMVSKPWVIDRTKLKTEHRRICRGLKGNQLTEEMKEAWEQRQSELFEQHPEWEDLFSLKLDGKPLMPSWPKGIVNHLQNEKK